MKIINQTKINTFSLLSESYINNDLFNTIRDSPKDEKIVLINKYIDEKRNNITNDEVGDLIAAFLYDNENRGSFEESAQFIEKVISYKASRLTDKEMQYLLMKTPHEFRKEFIDLITKLKGGTLSQPEQNVLNYYSKQ